MTQFVEVRLESAGEDAPTGLVPVDALAHWKEKGYVAVNPDEAAAQTTATVERVDVADPDGQVVAEAPGTTPETPPTTGDGTAAADADTSTTSQPTTTGRAGRAR